MDTGGLIIIFGTFGDLENVFFSPYILCTRSQRVTALVSEIQIQWDEQACLPLLLTDQFHDLGFASRSVIMWQGVRDERQPGKTEDSGRGGRTSGAPTPF